VIPIGGYRDGGPARGLRAARPAVVVGLLGAGLLLVGLIAVPLMVVGGSNMMLAAGNNCSSTGQGSFTTPATTVSSQGRDSIPANFLALFQQVGRQYTVPWQILAGIGEVESNDGRSNLPGVHSGSNSFGAAGPMQIGIGGAAGNVWGGAPAHPAGEQVNGVATDENGDGIASVYEPGDAIAGAAKYLLRNGVQTNVRGAIFAYNHLESYVQAVLYWASLYTKGGYTVSPVAVDVAAQCATLTNSQVPNQTVAIAIAYAEAQIGKPYQWGGTGPDAFDCSGLVMMAYRQAGVEIPRTSEEQWAWGPRIQTGHEEPGDLVFFAGSDGTRANPGHVGLVIGPGKMVEAYATGFPIRISSFGTSNSPPGDQVPVGFTRPWAHAGVVLPSQSTAQ
jgi:peptidoglycan DL-endopeptidase CwlO